METCLKCLGGAPNLIIGADIVQWPDSIVPLIETVSELLSLGGKDSLFVCGLVARSQWIRKRLDEVSATYHLFVQPWRRVKEVLDKDPMLSTSFERGSMEILRFQLIPENL